MRNHFAVFFLFFSIFVTSCRERVEDYFARESAARMEELIETLQGIETLDELKAQKGHVHDLFEDIADLMIEGREIEIRKGEKICPSERNRQLSEQLQHALNRLLAIGGAREVLIECQKDAISKLQAKEKKSLMPPRSK
jgi:hypothetical protein